MRTERFSLPQMLLIDGLDGSGKKTISTKLQEILTKLGMKVLMLDSPYYDSPTGKIVTDYLTKGYGDIRDRSLTSLYYTIDRMNYLRDHFGEIFYADSPYDFIIANRWTLSSLLYQTTVFPQKYYYSIQCSHYSVCAETNDPLPRFGRCYTILTDGGHTATNYTLEDLYLRVKDLEANNREGDREYRDLKFVMNHVRAQLVREHANMLYRLEIMPWWLEHANKTYLPFALFQSVVLLPDSNTAYQNMLHRNQNDASKLDDNETNVRYLESVAENIRWIHGHQSLIFAHTYPDPDDSDMEPIVSTDGAIRVLTTHIPGGQDYFVLSPAQLVPIEPIVAPARSFAYTIIDTTKAVSNDGEPKYEQKSKADVLREVWDALHLSVLHRLTDEDCIFPDD